MKKLVSLLLVFVLAFGLFAGCGQSAEPETQPKETLPQPTETPEEAKALKIMILGSSRSVNTFQLLYEAFKDQMPDQKLVLGIMYYSGCSMTMHAKFIQNNESVYDYYRNDSGRWVIKNKVHMDTGLCDDNWDVILLQAGTGDLANEMNINCRAFLQQYVDSRVKHPHVLWWHSTWFNSTDPTLYDSTKTSINPLTVDQYKQLNDNISASKAYVFEDPMFAGHINSGTPMMYALKVLGIPEKDLYRDHTHLSDYGCLLVAYAWYAQFTGKPVEKIDLTTIAAETRNPQYRHLGDLEVTQEMKDAILKTVKYTLENPWTAPMK